MVRALTAEERETQALALESQAAQPRKTSIACGNCSTSIGQRRDPFLEIPSLTDALAEQLLVQVDPLFREQVRWLLVKIRTHVLADLALDEGQDQV